MQHYTIYKNSEEYSSFPHITTDVNGDLLAVFRIAGKATATAAKTHTHTHQDLDAKIAFSRSTDAGQTWSLPITIHTSDPINGFTPNDPALTVLRSGRYLVRYAQWQLKPITKRHEIDGVINRHFVRRGLVGQICGDGFCYSDDQGRTWQLINRQFMTDETLASREAPIELADGSLLLPVYAGYPQRTEHAMIARSWDGGTTWQDFSDIATDPAPYRQGKNYNETSVIALDETTLLAVLRVDVTFITDDDDATFMSEGGAGELEWTMSHDAGFTWDAPKGTGIYGQPAHVLRLRDGSFLVTYGYRRSPYGVRAVHAQFSPQQGFYDHTEYIIRDDGTGWDVGYPASIQRQDGSLYTIYYMHHDDGIRYIAGTQWSL